MYRTGFKPLVWLVFGICLLAQWSATEAQTTGSIYGTARDESGAVLPGVTVTVKNDGNGLLRTAATSVAGDYTISSLPPGNYSLNAEREGFVKLELVGIQLSINQNSKLDLTLKVGGVTESVVVTAAGGGIELRDSALGEVVESRRIVDLPLNGRNFIQLGTLQAGVTPPPANVDVSQAGENETPGGFQVNFIVHGLRQDNNSFLLDGSINNDAMTGQAVSVPNPDFLEEFKILTGSFSAEFGRRAGSIVNVVTKSGTKQYHGGVYEFFRNDAFDARNFFVAAKPKLRQNQFGGNVGGPLYGSRTFFFGGFEGFRKRQGVPKRVAVPTLLERVGDFSQSARKPIDPVTGLRFSGDVIPPGQIDTVARNIVQANLWPLPNAGPNLWAGAPAAQDDREQFMMRVDRTWLGGRNQLTGRYLFDNVKILSPFGIGSFGAVSTSSPGFASADHTRAHNLMLMDSHTLSANFVNQFRFTYLRLNDSTNRTAQPLDPRQLGFTFPSVGDLSQQGLGIVSVAGISRLGKLAPSLRDNNDFSFEDAVSLNKGAHDLKFGGELRYSQINSNKPSVQNGFISASGAFSGVGFADFLLGRAFLFQLQGPEPGRNFRRTLFNLFWEDTFKVNPKLTITYGVRYDPLTYFHDTQDRLATVISGQKSVVDPLLPTGLVRVGDAGVSRSIAKPDWNNVAPRLGFAWDPFGSGETSVRGSYGVFYDEGTADFLKMAALGIPPDVSPLVTLVVPPVGLANPARNLVDPLHTIQAFPTVIHLSPDLRTPYIQQWSLGVQRKLPLGLVAEANYVGNKGTKLIGAIEFNYPALTAGATAGNAQSRRPLSLIGSAPRVQSGLNSNYHGGEFTLKRLGRDWTLVAAYTFSKAIDEVSVQDPSSQRIPGQAVIQNALDVKQDRGLSTFDIRNRFVTSFVWDLPGFAGKSGLASRVFGGWSVNGIVTLQSGRPFTVVDAIDRSLDGLAGDRPNLIGNPNLSSSERTAQRWFNTAAFATIVRGYGTAGRNIVFTDGVHNIDLSLLKRGSVSERVKLEFRTEFFNLFNHANLGIPDNNVSSPTFGQVLTTATPERIIQFGLKAKF